MKLVLVAMALAIAGCGTKANPASCLDDHCSDPARPFCDEDGSIGGEPDKCIAVECMAGEFGACRDDRALICNAAGDNYDLVDCMYGCSEEAGGCNACNSPECEKHIIPKYLPSACNQLTDRPDLIVSTAELVDTSTDLNCTSIVAQATAPEICVLRFRSITIKPGQTLTAVGSRVLALVADRAITIEGVLDVSSSYQVFGAGGGLVISGGAGNDPQGAGGAGAKGSGGAGGSAQADGGASNGGSATQPPAATNELVGGARGGGNNTGQNLSQFNSGAGGGAATLISCRDTVAVPGLVDAGGAGGRFGTFVGTELTYQPPGGGGAGGTVILQGMNVSVTGQLFANGGGGGAVKYGAPQMQDASNGKDGTRSKTAAQGGMSDVAGEGIGGTGGADTAAQGGPGRRPTANGKAGAGGGSAGYLMVFTPEGTAPTLTPIAISPSLEPNGTLATN